MKRRGRALSLAEVLLALGVLSVAVLAVAPMAARLMHSLRGGVPTEVELFMASRQMLEEARVQLHSGGLESLAPRFHEKSFGFDRRGQACDAGAAHVVCRIWVEPEDRFPECGESLMRVTAAASYRARPDHEVELVTLLAPPPPAEHVVISGFLKQEKTEGIHWDDFWGGYYGTAFGLQQGRAYREESVDPAHYPYPADPAGLATPPGPTPVPWGWR